MEPTKKAKANNAIKIIWEGVKLVTNKFVLLYDILNLFFLSSFLLFLVNNIFFLTPIVTDLSMTSIIVSHTDLPNLKSSILQDLKQIGLIEVIEIAVSFIITSLIATMSIYLLTSTYSGTKTANKLNLSTIKRAMITQLCIALLQGCVTLLIASLTILIPFALGIFLVVAASYFYFYIYAIFMMSMVVSVAEDDEGRYGIPAIDRAYTLLSRRRNQAVLVVLLEVAATMIVMGAYSFTTSYAKLNPMVVAFSQAASLSVIRTFELSVTTAYYYECKKSIDMEVSFDGGFMYDAIPSHVDEVLPCGN